VVRIGTYLSQAPSVGAAVGHVRATARAGLDSVFFGQVMGWDALTLATLAGREVPGVEVGTAIVPTYPRHPVALAGQALTASAAAGGRLTLGVGPSHRPVIEDTYGLAFDRPVQHTRDYLSILVPLLRGEPVDYHGPSLSAAGAFTTPGAPPPPVLLSALGPQMLALAGELADGTVTVWATAATIGTDVAPRIRQAAAAAGRPEPRVAAIIMATVTGDADRARQAVAGRVAAASGLPSYRALLDRQGLAAVHDTVLAGDEDAVAAGLRAYMDAGATDVLVSIIGDAAHFSRTLGLLAALRREAR
jgi:F420-dependent oxidoreductase-like protein